MFTGIIIEVGEIASINVKSGGLEICVKTREIYKDCKNGDSIAVNGVCLTVSKISDKFIFFDVMNESVKKTNLDTLRRNSFVNLETALRFNGKMDGHFVQGHIDCAGRIKSKTKAGSSVVLSISFPSEFSMYAAPRGSIAIDGASLTIAEKKGNTVKVSLVDFTQKNTTLSQKNAGDSVNIEFDIIGKYLFEFHSAVTQKKVYQR